jgi:hypothetical protein
MCIIKSKYRNIKVNNYSFFILMTSTNLNNKIKLTPKATVM